MEFFFFASLIHITLIFISLSSIYLLFYKIKNPSDAHNKQIHPPGTKGWPFFGESFEYMKRCRRGNPEKFINDRVEKYSPDVFQTSLLGENMAVFCGALGNKLLFTSENKYVVAWWPRSVLKAMLFQESQEEHSVKKYSTRFRRLLPEFLKPEALQHLIPVMDSMAKQHLKTDWFPYKEVKAFPLSRKYTFTLACRVFMSIENPDQVTQFSDPFSLVTSGMLSVPINFPGTAYNRAIKASKIILNELLAIIKNRKMELLEKKDMRTDLLTRMLLVEDDEFGKLFTEREIANHILAVLIASHDTISTTITFAIMFLAQHPHVYSEVFKEQMEIAGSKGPDELLNWEDIQKMKYSWCVACETMRLMPPSQGAFREAITDFTYAGFTIPKGWKTHWTVHSTHKNPKYFEDPEKFDPSRFEGNGPAPYTFVPFGGGPLMCPGKEYARLEILIFMHNVVTKFKWKKLIPNEKIIYDPSPVPVHGLPILLEPL
ncbi:beta-amyrin 6-beta-monooxygenase-like [Mercurialis annua]|uniref:beta-amyrin 6-beta-monooxygenase-like n=1 Tax=Mercurialis annua TaxID=3986 RepID=UPI00215F077F|nr:beta-amyrin 6-beta-monooxygenase-like [Mercurialis annua]